MKKMFLKSMAGMALICLVAFSAVSYDPKKSTGEAEQIEGFYIFTDSKPVMEYEYLGTVKATFAGDSQYTGVRDKLIKKAKKEYPNADGLIMHFKSGSTDKCDVIKFK